MNGLSGNNLTYKLKTAVKTFLTVFAALSLAVFSGCGLFTFGNDDGEQTAEDIVAVSPESASVRVGESVTLTATSSENRAISWSSSDEEIAEVDGGVVTGVKEGTALITASDGKQMASCEVEVLPEDIVAVSPKSASVRIGGSVTLTATSSANRAISWSSSDEEIAEVDGGVVTGVKEGLAIITASDGVKTASCSVAVLPAEGGTAVTITLSDVKKEINAGASFKLSATASDGSAVGFVSSNPAIAKVDGAGLVTGIKEGKANITASNAAGISAVCEVTVIPADARKLIWSDEFNGNSLDASKWGFQKGVQDDYYGNKGPEYWGNGELQYYTDGANVKVADGALQITAKREDMPNGRTYSSARIATRDNFSTTFGYIEARIKSPAIEGMWPAFWMLPQPPNHSSTNNEYGGWPANGELDIMEAKGRLLNKVDCTLHFGGPDWNVHDMAGKGNIVLGSNIDEWHTYAVDWRADYIAWIIDGVEVARVSASRWWTSASKVSSAPFDKPYYILINLAVGGQYDGYRVPPSGFTQASMYVDYVRVYE